MNITHPNIVILTDLRDNVGSIYFGIPGAAKYRSNLIIGNILVVYFGRSGIQDRRDGDSEIQREGSYGTN